MEAILNAPAADVVEVVRCRQCQYWTGKDYDGCCIKSGLDTRFALKFNSLRTEAIKEFAGKVRRYIKSYCNPYGKPTLDYDTSLKIMHFIDNLVKEMVGDE